MSIKTKLDRLDKLETRAGVQEPDEIIFIWVCNGPGKKCLHNETWVDHDENVCHGPDNIVWLDDQTTNLLL